MGLLAIIAGLLGLGFWKIGMFVVEKQNRDAANVQHQQEIKTAKEEEENKKTQTLQQQKALIEKFSTSPTTQEMLHVICKGDPQQNLPKEIVICDNSITGYHADGLCTFDFASNRVHSFYPVGGAALDRAEFKYLIRPQMAMAEALNRLFSNQYAISDNARVEMNRHTDCDGDPYYIYTYNSNNVRMVLKSTLPNRSF